MIPEITADEIRSIMVDRFLDQRGYGREWEEPNTDRADEKQGILEQAKECGIDNPVLRCESCDDYFLDEVLEMNLPGLDENSFGKVICRTCKEEEEEEE